MCVGMDCFGFMLFRILSTSSICSCRSFVKFWEFSSIISSSTFSALSFFSPLVLMTWILDFCPWGSVHFFFKFAFTLVFRLVSSLFFCSHPCTVGLKQWVFKISFIVFFTSKIWLLPISSISLLRLSISLLIFSVVSTMNILLVQAFILLCVEDGCFKIFDQSNMPVTSVLAFIVFFHSNKDLPGYFYEERFSFETCAFWVLRYEILNLILSSVLVGFIWQHSHRRR